MDKKHTRMLARLLTLLFMMWIVSYGYEETGNKSLLMDYVLCKDQTECPKNFTCCNETNPMSSEGYWDCCPIKNAVCCEKMNSCCPQNYHCNATTKTCNDRTEVISMTRLSRGKKRNLNL